MFSKEAAAFITHTSAYLEKSAGFSSIVKKLADTSGDAGRAVLNKLVDTSGDAGRAVLNKGRGILRTPAQNSIALDKAMEYAAKPNAIPDGFIRKNLHKLNDYTEGFALDEVYAGRKKALSNLLRPSQDVLNKRVEGLTDVVQQGYAKDFLKKELGSPAVKANVISTTPAQLGNNIKELASRLQKHVESYTPPGAAPSTKVLEDASRWEKPVAKAVNSIRTAAEKKPMSVPKKILTGTGAGAAAFAGYNSIPYLSATDRAQRAVIDEKDDSFYDPSPAPATPSSNTSTDSPSLSERGSAMYDNVKQMLNTRGGAAAAGAGAGIALTALADKLLGSKPKEGEEESSGRKVLKYLLGGALGAGAGVGIQHLFNKQASDYSYKERLQLMMRKEASCLSQDDLEFRIETIERNLKFK